MGQGDERQLEGRVPLRPGRYSRNGEAGFWCDRKYVLRVRSGRQRGSERVCCQQKRGELPDPFLGQKGIRVVGVAPGFLEATGLRTLSDETALAYTRGITIEQLREGYSTTSTTPLGRSGKLSEVANTVAFLLSDGASYVHGVTLNVAGGKTRG